MPNQNDDKHEMPMMWIASAAIALLTLGAMGINMLVHHDTSAAMPGELVTDAEVGGGGVVAGGPGAGAIGQGSFVRALAKS
jgi:hypothetical protein